MLYNNNEKSMGFRSQKLAGPGRLITLEGIDGTGKTTQISSLASAIRKQDISVLELREPGGTAIGEAIRRILLDNRNTGMCSESEMLLFAAARAQLVREVIRPALAAGTWVVCDRFSDSTLAYQGYGRGADLEIIEKINNLAVGSCRPDRTVLLDLSPDAALERLGRRPDKADRLDIEGRTFMKRVREGYLAIAAGEPQRFIVVDAGQPARALAQEIFSKIWGA
ncbi:MAG: dTMP kinase [Saccharofermentanales bacterium]|jgi:dTMP kinase